MTNIRYYLDLLIVLVEKDFKLKYKYSILGYLWSVLHPLLLAIIFSFVFKSIIKVGIENYFLYLISGLFAWHWISNSILSSPSTLLINANIIKKVYFQRFLLVVSPVVTDLIHFVLSIPVILFFFYLYNAPITIKYLPLIPIALVPIFFTILGISLVISVLNIFFRDLERLVHIGLTVLFYATPIIYTMDMVPENKKSLFLFNPFYLCINNLHGIFFYGKVDFNIFMLSVLYSIVIFSVGIFIFKKLEYRAVETL